MAASTIERINQLSEERARLFREAANGRRRDSLARARELSAELEQLWELRRAERVGRMEGVDLLVDHTYRRLYGPRYEEALAPGTVGEAVGDDAALAA